MNVTRVGVAGEPFAHELLKTGAELVARSTVMLKNDVGVDRLSADWVGFADDGRFGDGGVPESAFSISKGPIPIAGCEDEVVGASAEGEETVAVVGGRIAGEVVAAVAGEWRGG